MRRFWNTFAVVLALFSLCRVASAHPGHSHTKSATSNNPQPEATSRIRETFVAVSGGRIQVRRSNDALVSHKLSDLSEVDRHWVEQRMVEIRRANQALAQNEASFLLAQNRTPRAITTGKAPAMARAFEAFVKSQAIQTRWDDRFFYVESNGMPKHPLMVGITSWQQQVPLPQPYVGENAWRIPLHPVPAREPLSTKGAFLRGAIALAVNGIPIFNPLNNRGDDAYLFGELDEYGGHCGRADDYHYHIAPVHLEKTAGKGLPIAYALDGYPIYGYTEPDGSAVTGLDEFNGHAGRDGNYHYHATKTYPYLNGGFHGEVTERDGQVDPQPRPEPLREAGSPMRNTQIVGFEETQPGSYRLTYELNGKQGSVSYVLNQDGSAKFTYVATTGVTDSETYTPRRRGPGGGDRPPRPGEDRPPRDGQQPPPRPGEEISENTPALEIDPNLPNLAVTSTAVDAKGFIGKEYTCDGASASPQVSWTGAPAGTKCYAVNVWHTPGPGDTKSYWLVYNIPGNVASLDKNSKGIGTAGLNDKRRAAYDPMCSKGPGVKTYHITVYALSKEPNLAPSQAHRAHLLAAIQDITLAAGTLDFQYERKANALLPIIGGSVVALLIAGGLSVVWIRRRQFGAVSLKPCLALVSLILFVSPVGAAESLKPVKIFILAGQSNMEGQAVVDLEGKDYNDGKGTLATLLKDPAKRPQLLHLRNADGTWVIRDDVWCRYKREHGPLLAGPLAMGFSVYGDRHHFGPELEFGHVIGDHLEQPVLLIKTAWGGKSLYKDFRPPSSGGEIGPYYTKMIAEVREALTHLKTDFPSLADRGSELAGFVWYHGWNDGVDPQHAIPEYEQNLVNLIHDVRKEFQSPQLPVVIGELTGPWVDAPKEWETLRKAQAAAAARPEFQGTVVFVPTRDFVRKPEDSPNPGHGHHEFGNAETYFLVGQALGEGMKTLLKR